MKLAKEAFCVRQSLTAANERPRSLWRSNIRSLSISRRLHHRQIGWFHTLENLCGVEPRVAIPVCKVRPVTDPTARFGKFGPCVHGGQFIAARQGRELVHEVSEGGILCHKERGRSLSSDVSESSFDFGLV